MENCYKTQLKGTVNNDALEFLGSTNVYFDANENLALRQFIVGFDGNALIKVLKGKVYTDSARTQQIPSEYIQTSVKRYYIGAEETIIAIPKYNIVNYNLAAVYQGVFEGYGSSDFLNYNTLTGDIGINCKDDINMNIFAGNDTIRKLSLKGNSITGGLSSILDSASILESLCVLNSINGELLDLVDCNSLEIIDCRGISGELQTFATQMNVNRKSGTLHIFGNGIITNNNLTIPDRTTVTITFNQDGFVIS